MVIVKEDINVLQKEMDLKDARGVTMQILIGPEDNSTNIIMRLFKIAPKGYTPLHEHSYEHIVHIQRGEGVLLCNSETQRNEIDYSARLKPQMSIFIPGGLLHQFKNTGNEPLEFICVIPNPDRLPQSPACMG